MEALVGDQYKKFDIEERQQEEVLNMTWNLKNGNSEWLNRSAVGTLKSFDSVSLVNERLSSRGFSFLAN